MPSAADNVENYRAGRALYAVQCTGCHGEAGKGVAEARRIDLEQTEFLAPWALTLLCTHALWLHQENDSDVQIRFDPSTRAGSYAVQAGLYELLDAERPPGAPATNDTLTAPLTQVTKEDQIPSCAAAITSLLRLAIGPFSSVPSAPTLSSFSRFEK